MSNAAEKFADRAERYAKDRNRLRGDGEAVAHYVLNCAERVQLLDDRLFDKVPREAYMDRIWAAYQAVNDYLDSGAPYNLDSPEIPFWGDMLSDMATEDADWDGCPEQVLVDNQYEGYD